MNRLSKIILIPIVFVALFCGFLQLSSNNTVFDKTQVYCCNTGACNGEPCNAPASISMLTNGVCKDYAARCEDCNGVYWSEPCPMSHDNFCY